MTAADMKKLTERMFTDADMAISFLEYAKVRHDVVGEEHECIHRIVVDEVEGPWVSKHAIAANGPFRATTVHYEAYFGLPMPRLFFVLAIQPHSMDDVENAKLRQLAEGPQGPAATDSCSNPAPGAEDKGSETDSSSVPPHTAAGDEPVPRYSGGGAPAFPTQHLNTPDGCYQTPKRDPNS